MAQLRLFSYALAMADHHAELSDFLDSVVDVPPTKHVDADVFGALGIDGDDGFEFIDKFAARFGTDMSGYRWYFHHGEEGWGIGGLLFRPPYDRVETIPITRAILVEAIRTGRWPIEYPPHVLPRFRWDVTINQAVALGVVVLAGVWVWRQFVR